MPGCRVGEVLSIGYGNSCGVSLPPCRIISEGTGPKTALNDNWTARVGCIVSRQPARLIVADVARPRVDGAADRTVAFKRSRIGVPL